MGNDIWHYLDPYSLHSIRYFYLVISSYITFLIIKNLCGDTLFSKHIFRRMYSDILKFMHGITDKFYFLK